MTKQEKLFLAIVIPALLAFFLVMAFLSQGTFGGEDDFHHYRIARYAWQYPSLFLDLWGKPLYNLLSSPFAQFGMKGSRVFNVLTGLATAFFTFKVARKIGLHFSPALIFLVCFTPMYTVLMLSGMTEILFSFVLVLAVFLFLDEHYIGSAIAISFLPFARNEGFIILPLFLIAYLLLKQYRAIPFLVTGYLLVTLSGVFYYHDWLWIVHQTPYGNAPSYGHGTLMHFVNNLPKILGYPILALFVAGLFTYLPGLLRRDKKQMILLLLLPGSFFIYFTAHSYVWWKGTGGSLGMIRVIAAVTPVAAIIAWQGMDRILSLIRKKELRTGIAVVAGCIVVVIPFTVYPIPVPPSPEQKAIKEACNWLVKNGYANRKINYYDPFFIVDLKISPYDKDRAQERVPDPSAPENGIEPGTLVLWDAHFSPNEGNLPLEKLTRNPYFRALKVIRPIESFQVLNHYNYEIWIFERLGSAGSAKAMPVETVPAGDLLWFEGFENPSGSAAPGNRTNTQFFEGEYACRLDSTLEFGPTYEEPVEKLSLNGAPGLEASAEVFPLSKGPYELFLVLSIEHHGRLYIYRAFPFPPEATSCTWRSVDLRMELPRLKSGKDILKMYLWNKGKKNYLIDNLKLQRIGE